MLLAENRLRKDFGISDEQFAELRASVDEEAQDAWDFAEESPAPSIDTLYDHVYAP